MRYLYDFKVLDRGLNSVYKVNKAPVYTLPDDHGWTSLYLGFGLQFTSDDDLRTEFFDSKNDKVFYKKGIVLVQRGLEHPVYMYLYLKKCKGTDNMYTTAEKIVIVDTESLLYDNSVVENFPLLSQDVKVTYDKNDVVVMKSADINSEDTYNKHNNDESLNRLLNKYKCLTNVNELVVNKGTIVEGMNDEIALLEKGLMHMRKPNVMIKGEPGVGKTALVEKLALSINEGKVPEQLKNNIVLELSIGASVAGTKYRGEFEEKLNDILNLVSSRDDLILFVDEAHTIIGAGGAEGAIDASNIFKPYLARGDIKLIGATTNEEFEKYISKDKAFKRRFSVIEIQEPREREVKNIMLALLPKMNEFYKMSENEDILDDIYEKSLLRKGLLPDIALDEMEDYFIEKKLERQKVTM